MITAISIIRGTMMYTEIFICKRFSILCMNFYRQAVRSWLHKHNGRAFWDQLNASVSIRIDFAWKAENNVKGFLTSANIPQDWRITPWYLLLASIEETFKIGLFYHHKHCQQFHCSTLSCHEEGGRPGCQTTLGVRARWWWALRAFSPTQAARHERMLQAVLYKTLSF